MKTVRRNIDRKKMVNIIIVKDESLRNGQSITKAIITGGRNCCGGAYAEQA